MTDRIPTSAEIFRASVADTLGLGESADETPDTEVLGELRRVMERRRTAERDLLLLLGELQIVDSLLDDGDIAGARERIARVRDA